MGMVTTTDGDTRLVYVKGKITNKSLTSHLVTMGGGDTSAADKKRNKLGYHRTAIACGHCRRRKIRCIPPAEPTSNRCQNCVRLKKDCQYYPVDQNNQISTKRTSDTKGDGLTAGSETSVSSSSPRLSMGNTDPYDLYRASLESPNINHAGSGAYAPIAAAGSMDQYGYSPQFAGSQWSQQGSFAHQSRHVGDDRQPNALQSEGYWPQSDQITPVPYDTSGYAVTTTETSPSMTVADQRYPVYPVATQEYGYGSQQARGSNLGNGTSMAYGIYRPDTMSNPMEPMTSPTYPTVSSQPQYQPVPGMASRWSDAMQVQPTYSPSNNQYSWYGPGTVDSGSKARNSHVLASQTDNRGQYQANPG